jgi:hypothetical protein
MTYSVSEARAFMATHARVLARHRFDLLVGTGRGEAALALEVPAVAPVVVRGGGEGGICAEASY